MSVSGVKNPNHPPLVGTASGNPGDRTPSQPVDSHEVGGRGGRLVSTQISTGSGDIPTPQGPDGWQRRQRQLQQLTALAENLRSLATAGDRQAQLLLAEIEQVIAGIESESSRDIDSDGVPDSFDPDADGDNITNEREAHDGTNPFHVDTDGDGISDDDEIRLRNLGRLRGDSNLVRRGNPTSADGDGDGIIDSAQLTADVRGILESAASSGGQSLEIGTQANDGGLEITAVPSPFEASDVEPLTEPEVREGVQEFQYDLAGRDSLTFRMLEEFEGEELKQWTISRDGQSLRVEGKNREGETRVRYILRGALDEDQFNLANLQFQLADTGQRVDSDTAVRIRGGAGDDMVYTVGGAGSQVHLGAGDDMAIATDDNAVEFHGQGGDDILRGAGGDDRLEAGAGNDFVYGGTGSNRLYGGEGNDTLWTANTTIDSGSEEIVDGGAGLDTANAYNGTTMGIEMGIKDLNGLQTYLSQYSAEGASAIELSEIVNLETEDLPYIRQLISEQLHQLSINYMLLKEAEWQAGYVSQPGDGQMNTWNTTGGPATQFENPLPENNSDPSDPDENQGGGWRDGYIPL